MWRFWRKKTIRGLAGPDQVALSDGSSISFDEIAAAFTQIGRDLGVLTQACQRIERKQLRWLEMLNIKEDAETLSLPLIQQPGQVALGGNNPIGETALVAGEPTEQ